MRLNSTDAIALVEIWAGIKTYIHIKDQKQAAEQFIALSVDAGLIDLSISAAELYGVCDVFDNALKHYCEENGLLDNDDDDYDWDE